MTCVKISFPRAPRLDGMPRRVQIERCSDASFWYRDLVGKVVMIEAADSCGYWAREGGEFNCINVIKHEDATLLPLEN